MFFNWLKTVSVMAKLKWQDYATVLNIIDLRVLEIELLLEGDVDPDLKAKLYEEKASIFRVLAKFPSRYA